MAARIRLSSLAAWLAAVLMADPGSAQEPGARPAAAPAPAPSWSQKPPGQEECAKLPGGNAPVARMARLEGGISVRNLEFTYLGKPLFQLTADDYAYLEALWPVCKTFDATLAPTVARRLKALVDDAKGVRQESLDWIRKTEQQAKALKPGQDGIEKIHDLWQQMLNREFQMTAFDMSHISGVLSKRRDELYSSPQPRQRTLVSPFDPGPPDVRGLGGSGG